MPKRLTIEEAKQIGESKGGKCLSTEYKRAHDKLLWECGKGHQFEASMYSVKTMDSWCAECQNRKKLTIEKMQEIAESRGGKCLSKEYVNVNTPLMWECKEGHTWPAAPSSVKNLKTWCPTCDGQTKLTIEEMQKLAESRGGNCLSKEYVNSKTDLKWKCANGHTFKATPSNVKNHNSWCSKCSKRKKLTIEEMHEHATSKGGKCLSTEYINNQTKLEWECANGHVWKASPLSIRAGSWCNQCHLYLGEEKCRYTLEKLLQYKFKKDRHTLGNRYELDGYNEELKIAFEHHGKQHYEYTRPYHRKKEDLEKQQKTDEHKRNLCKDLGINLIEIKYTVSENDKELVVYLMNELNKLNVTVSVDVETFSFEGLYEYISPLNQLRKIAEENGGKCLTNQYVNKRTHMKWECSEGHVWEASALSIQNGIWCEKCKFEKSLKIKDAQNKEKNLLKLKEMAIIKGGKILSNEYKNNYSVMTCQCENGHIFERKASSIRRGGWCDECKK